MQSLSALLIEASPTPSLTALAAMVTATATATAAASPTPTVSPTLGPPPCVVASYPLDGDRAVHPGRPLILVFDRPMAMASVIANLVISPGVAFEIVAQDARRLLVAPEGGWVAEEYQITLRGEAMDAHGRVMGNPFTLSFSSKGGGVRLPVLMYHHIWVLPDDATELDRTWSVSPEAFSEQMTYLAREGWHSVSPAELYAYLQEGAPLPPKAIIISMDDGYREVYDVALPVFQETGLRPVLFIISEHLGYSAYLSWEQLEELVTGGVTIGSHTMSHMDLRALGEADLRRELAGSRELLEQELGVTVDSFCYPYGSYDARIIAAVEAQGYTTAFTLNSSAYQSPDEPLRLNRLLITYEMSLTEFAELFPE